MLDVGPKMLVGLQVGVESLGWAALRIFWTMGRVFGTDAAQFLAPQAATEALVCFEGHILCFKVSSPVGLSALITFHISMLAPLGIDHLPTLSMWSGLCSAALVWFESTIIYLSYKWRRRIPTQLNQCWRGRAPVMDRSFILPAGPPTEQAVHQPETDTANTVWCSYVITVPNKLECHADFLLTILLRSVNKSAADGEKVTHLLCRHVCDFVKLSTKHIFSRESWASVRLCTTSLKLLKVLDYTF